MMFVLALKVYTSLYFFFNLTQTYTSHHLIHFTQYVSINLTPLIVYIYWFTRHNCMTAADSAVVLLELDVQWDLARTH